MTRLAEQLVAERWFASKAREVSNVEVVDEIALLGDLRLSFVEPTFSTGTRELYQLIRDPSGMDVLAARATDLVSMMAEGAEVEGGDAVVRFHSVGDLSPGATARPVGADQSNSSVIVDEELALKAYRRLEPGINPELEIVRFLTDHGYDNVPALRGWYEVEGRLLDATLGVLQTYVVGARDGWQVALDELASDPDGLVDRLLDLGRAIGGMHTVLASDGNDPAFAPEQPSQEAIGLLTATIDEDIERMFFELAGTEATAPIEGRGEEIRERLRTLTQIAAGGRVIRHHGDLHLGQTLLADGRWMVIDFEGEPGRQLAERRRKRSPLRDVAGMLRSFAYAASATQIQRGVAAPGDWEARARDAFLGGYMETVDETLLPPGRGATAQLLAIYELEKAVYELRYELNNRPDWVGIPVTGVLRLLDAEA